MSAEGSDHVNLWRCGAITALECQQRDRASVNVEVVIPALNEAAAIGGVVRAIPRSLVRGVCVVDNGSTDGTAEVARAAGARVIVEPRRGYGTACLAGLRALPADTDIVVFLDADGSDDPSLLPELARPIMAGTADLVVGSRTGGKVEPGALTMQQRIAWGIGASIDSRLYFYVPGCRQRVR